MTLTCYCGHVCLELRKRPNFINACNCSLCRKASAHWSYLHPSEVSVAGATTGCDRSGRIN